MYFVTVSGASFVAAGLANILYEPDRHIGLLCLAISLIAGALAWLAETVCATRERRLAVGGSGLSRLQLLF